MIDRLAKDFHKTQSLYLPLRLSFLAVLTFEFQLKLNLLYFYPLYRDLKEHLRRMQQQSDSRRRAAVMEMMRQRAAEVASGSG